MHYSNRPIVALFQPEIPQNTGTIIRTCAAFGLKLYIIGPTGFIWDSKFLKRSAMDYMQNTEIIRTNSLPAGNIIAATCQATTSYYDYKYKDGDILLFGPESVGLPENILAQTNQSVTIPMQSTARSLNVSNAVSIITSHALLSMNNLLFN